MLVRDEQFVFRTDTSRFANNKKLLAGFPANSYVFSSYFPSCIGNGIIIIDLQSDAAQPNLSSECTHLH